MYGILYIIIMKGLREDAEGANHVENRPKVDTPDCELYPFGDAYRSGYCADNFLPGYLQQRSQTLHAGVHRRTFPKDFPVGLSDRCMCSAWYRAESGHAPRKEEGQGVPRQF